MNRPIAATPAPPRAATSPRRSSVTPPIASTGHAGGPHDVRQPRGRAPDDRRAWPRSARPSRRSDSRRRPRRRPLPQPRARNGRSGTRGARSTERRPPGRSRPQVHAGGAARQRHVEPIVDDDAGACSPRHGDDLRHRGRQIGRVEIALADLNEVDAGIDRRTAPAAEDTLARPGIGTVPAQPRRSVTRCRIRARPAYPRHRRSARRAEAARGEHRHELGEAGHEVDDAETADGAAHEVVREESAERRPRLREVVAFPERRPGQDDQQQPDLDEEGDTQQATEEQSAFPRSRATRCLRNARVHRRILHFR